MAGTESASAEVKDDLRKLFLKIADQHSSYRELTDQVRKNHSEMLKIKDAEMKKISQYFKFIKSAIEERENEVKMSYEE